MVGTGDSNGSAERAPGMACGGGTTAGIGIAAETDAVAGFVRTRAKGMGFPRCGHGSVGGHPWIEHPKATGAGRTPSMGHRYQPPRPLGACPIPGGRLMGIDCEMALDGGVEGAKMQPSGAKWRKVGRKGELDRSSGPQRPLGGEGEPSP